MMTHSAKRTSTQQLKNTPRILQPNVLRALALHLVLPPPVAEASGRSPVDRQQPDRLREMSRNAEETISGMSEATIDSMMGGLQRLKDRLAERRAQQFQDPQEPLATATPRAASPEEPPHPRHWV
ncbi:hypothetical protein EDB86DRAFT_261636 [Lactarius hatsudake]|nr:hypothetical protein EDB86DRAFT_261636 [Lactarius hatsudake]